MRLIVRLIVRLVMKLVMRLVMRLGTRRGMSLGMSRGCLPYPKKHRMPRTSQIQGRARQGIHPIPRLEIPTHTQTGHRVLFPG